MFSCCIGLNSKHYWVKVVRVETHSLLDQQMSVLHFFPLGCAVRGEWGKLYRTNSVNDSQLWELPNPKTLLCVLTPSYNTTTYKYRHHWSTKCSFKLSDWLVWFLLWRTGGQRRPVSKSGRCLWKSLAEADFLALPESPWFSLRAPGPSAGHNPGGRRYTGRGSRRKSGTTKDNILWYSPPQWAKWTDELQGPHKANMNLIRTYAQITRQAVHTIFTSDSKMICWHAGKTNSFV